MSLRKLLYFFLLNVSVLPLFSQQTYIYEELNKDFKHALFLYDNETYVAAEREFEVLLNKIQHLTAPEVSNFKLQSQYYQAVCAKKLKHPQAEEQLRHFVDEKYRSVFTRLAHYHLGDYYYNKKSFAKALAQYKFVLPSDLRADEIDDFKFNKAYCYFYSKELDEAYVMFNQLKAIEGKYFYPSNYYYGFISYLRDDYDNALTHFLKVDKSATYKQVVPYYIAHIYFSQKKYNDVLSYATPLANDNSIRYQTEIQQLIGKTYYKQKSFTKALPYLEQYVKKTRKVRKEDVYQLAYAQYQSGKYNDAIKNFEELNVVKDTLGQYALYNLGDSYIKTNNKNKARSAFQEAAKLNYNQKIKETSLFNSAKLSAELGFHKQAIGELQTFIGRYPASSYNLEAKETLSNLFLSTSNYVEALKVMDGMGNLNSTMQRAYQKVAFNRALELYNDNKMQDALALFSKSQKYNADRNINAKAEFWQGEINYRKDNFSKSIYHFEQFLSLSTSTSTVESKNNAHYNIAYANIKGKKYDAALTQLNKISGSEKKIANDVTLRKADCQFMLKDYGKAIGNYEKAIALRDANSAYAIYQKGIIQGLQNNNSAKITSLQTILSQYPNSLYADDALFEIGNTYINSGNFTNAKTKFDELITRYPKSNLVKKAMVQNGLIAFNNKDLNGATRNYEKVIEQFPKTKEASESISALKEVYIAKGDPGGYFKYLNSIGIKNISSAQQDSVTYLAAESSFIEGNCNKAISNFDSYLKGFPNGLFESNAHFYKAECNYKNQNYKAAIVGYEQIINKPNNIFSEKSLIKAARIAQTINKDQQSAYDYFKKLEAISSYREFLEEAQLGLLRASHSLRFNNEISSYGSIVLNSSAYTTAEKAEADFYLGMVALRQKNTVNAETYFRNVVGSVNNEQAAEAQYNIALLKFNQNQYDASETATLYLIKELSSYEYWVVKGYILLADIYEKKDNIFQAKATLNSIIANYQGADLKNEAQAKLDALIAKEQQQSKIKSDTIGKNVLEIDTNFIPGGNQ